MTEREGVPTRPSRNREARRSFIEKAWLTWRQNLLRERDGARSIFCEKTAPLCLGRCFTQKAMRPAHRALSRRTPGSVPEASSILLEAGRVSWWG